jgi:Ni/Co efflux regulator RcnB
MKISTLLSSAAALALAGPLVMPASAQAGRDGPSQRQYERPQETRADNDHRGRDRRESWREDRRDARWDEARHNGYYENNRWTYGPPPSDRYQRGGFSLGYRPWEVGQSLGYYQNRFERVDYRRQNLRRPGRGAHWVRDDRGDYLLVSRSGRITQVVVSGAQPRDRNQSWRDDRSDARWDNSRHNGYYRESRWTFGPPPSGQADNVTYGYQPWRRGERLGYYNGRYAEVDYRANQSLRAPPRGYHWVRSDGGDYLLVAIAGGLIAQVIMNSTN